jgi:penicillin amidase
LSYYPGLTGSPLRHAVAREGGSWPQQQGLNFLEPSARTTHADKIRYLKAILSLCLAALLTWLLSVPLGKLPALGHFMSPASGFWQNMQSDSIADLSIASEKLNRPVEVYYDARGVPHIFAENDYDLYFAQGFVTARDRLWQIDFQARAAAGRLSEILGPLALGYDRAQRRLGMQHGAENNLRSIMEDSQSALAVQAYTDGYNAWLESLSPKDYPLEFKILGYEPEAFTPLNTALTMMSVAQTLTANTRAHAQSNARVLLPPEVYEKLYPLEIPWVKPMIPAGHSWDFDPVSTTPPESDFVPNITKGLELPHREPGAGSNSWAVDGSRTQSGYPMLASDPHLGVTLPSIWYEIHLNSEALNVYGASIPGSPGVIIGFNENCAWGITNGDSISLDVYEIEFKDEAQNYYWHDEQWKEVLHRVEVIKIKGKQPHIETVPYTHHGPVALYSDKDSANSRYPHGHAIQWMAHRPGNILRAILNYNRAENLQQFQKALRDFDNISMNFTYADREGNISIGHYGHLPVRFSGQGEFISDGRDPAYDWSQLIPFEHLPRIKNPDHGFVFTANQAPVSKNYPYFLGRFYADFNRNHRIHDLLENSSGITMENFEEMLMDNRALTPAKILPFKLSKLQIKDGDSEQSKLIQLLSDWSGDYDSDSAVALFFPVWQREFSKQLWLPLFDPENDIHLFRPYFTVTMDHLLKGDWDIFPVDVVDAVNASFQQSFEQAITQYGADPENWHYGTQRKYHIQHLAYIPGLGRQNINTGGHPEAINAMGNVFAPSWRMVVELGPEIRAKIHYSGGQTANPGHPQYDRAIDDWATGRLHEANFWQTSLEAAAQSQVTLNL